MGSHVSRTQRLPRSGCHLDMCQRYADSAVLVLTSTKLYWAGCWLGGMDTYSRDGSKALGVDKVDVLVAVPMLLDSLHANIITSQASQIRSQNHQVQSMHKLHDTFKPDLQVPSSACTRSAPAQAAPGSRGQGSIHCGAQCLVPYCMGSPERLTVSPPYL